MTVKNATTVTGVDSNGVSPEMVAALHAETGTPEQEIYDQQDNANEANGFIPDDNDDEGDPSVEEEITTTDASTRPLKPHEQQALQMEKIAARKRALIHKEVNTPDIVDEDIDNTVESSTEQDALQSAQANGKAPAAAAPATTEQDVRGFFVDGQGNRMVRTVINGVQTDIPEHIVLANLQKFEAGDAKLREAAQRNDELNRREQDILARQQQQTTAQPSTQDVASVAVKELLQQRAAVYTRMYNGDESAISELVDLDDKLADAKVKALTTPQIDVRAQLQQISHEQRVADWGKQVGESEAAMLADPSYADVAKSTTTWGAVAAEAGRLVKEQDAFNRGLSPRDIMKQAVENVRRDFAPAPAPTVDVRAQRKQQIGNTALAAGSQGSVAQRQHVPPARPDGGPSPSEQRKAAIKELQALKKER